jgi:uncharacterized damage-inducible protein DinB
MNAKSGILVALVGCCSTITLAQARQGVEPEQKVPTIAAVLDRQLSNVEKDVVNAAEAMPEEKYDFAPTNGEFKGVRTFAQQVKHVAYGNYGAFAIMLGEKPPENSPDENGPDTVKSKEDILKYLRGSFAMGHRALGTITAQNAVVPIKMEGAGEHPETRLSMYSFVIGHSENHYGQMIEYLRMNGIIPPASRPAGK